MESILWADKGCVLYTFYTLFFFLFFKEVSLGLETYAKPMQNLALRSTCLDMSTHRLDNMVLEGQ